MKPPPMLPMRLEPVHGLEAELRYRIRTINDSMSLRFAEVLGETPAVLPEILHWNAVMWEHLGPDPARCVEATAKLSAAAVEVLGLAGVHVPKPPPLRPRTST